MPEIMSLPPSFAPWISKKIVATMLMINVTTNNSQRR